MKTRVEEGCPRHDLTHGLTYGLAFVLLLAALLCFFGPAFIRGDFYFSRDLTSYHYPMKSMIRQVVERGGFPYWNPAQGGGEPMAANPAYEMFYPPQWLIFVGPFYLGYRLHILLHVLLAAAGMFLLLRQLALQPWSCLAGALAFALGGPYLSLIRLLPFLFSVTWIPWIFYFFDRYRGDRRARWFAGTALALAMQALIGEPIIAGETWLLMVAFAFWRGASGERRKLLYRALLLIVLANGVAAVQLIPGADHARDSVRSRGFSWSMVSTWSLHPARPLEMCFPALFRHLGSGNGETMLGSMYPDGDPFVQDWYCGVLIILGASALAFRMRRSGTLLGAPIVVALYVISIGRYTPLLRWLYDAGFFHWLRYTEKFWLPVSVIVIGCGAMALDRLLLGDRPLRKTLITLNLVWLVAAGLILATHGTDRTYGWQQLIGRGVALLVMLVVLSPSYASKTPEARLSSRSLTAARDDTVRDGRENGGWILRRLRMLVAPALVLFFFVDCAYLQKELLPTMPREFFSPPPADRQLPVSRDYRLFHQADWEWDKGSPRATAYFVEDDTFFWSYRNGEFPRQPWAWGHFVALQQDIDGTALIPSADLLRSMFAVRDRGRGDWAEVFMAMSNAGYRAVLRPFIDESARVNGDLRKASPVDFVPTARYPRYYFADQIVSIANRDEFVSKLTSAEWSRRVAFVSIPAFVPAPGRVVSILGTDSSSLLNVICQGHSYLVISITPHKYWKARVDGQEVPLHVTNVGYQGLELSSGNHRLELRYRNPLIAVGGIVSLLALAAVFLAGRKLV